MFFIFLPTHILKPILANRTNGTFGFARHTSQPFAKPKEPIFPAHNQIQFSTFLNFQMPIHEDIFGAGNAIELIVRWHDKIIADFDNSNQKTFEQLKNLIDGQELKCYFLKVLHVL